MRRKRKKAKGPGRPPKYGAKTARLGLYGPAELIEWIRAQADARNMKTNAFLLEIVKKAKSESEEN